MRDLGSNALPSGSTGVLPTPNKAECLRSALADGRIVRAFGCGDAASALIAERSGYEAVWASGLAISTARGVPDASIVTMSEMLQSTASMVDRTRLPVIADCDSGFGDVNILARVVQDYARAGVAAICIEDKEFPKRNSFRANGNFLRPAAVFAAMLESAADVRGNLPLLLIARTEALVVGDPINEAIERALLYESVGADVILVHSRAQSADEVLSFAACWRDAGGRAHLAAVPTTYPATTLDELQDAGYGLVIYANQGLRAGLRAIEQVARRIIIDGTSLAVETDIASIQDVFDLVGTEDVDLRTARFEATELRLQVSVTAHADRQILQRLDRDDSRAETEPRPVAEALP